MNELQRLAYLEAMDIPSYVSRRNLPGAAQSRRLVIARRTPAVTTGAAPQDALAALSRQVGKPAGQPATLAPSVAAAVSETTETPVFSVVAAAAGGWLWLDEIPAGREPGEDYGQLLLAICRAMGMPEPTVRVDRFNYPVTPGLAGGIEEARQALVGFIHGRISRASPRGVVLLGEFSEPWFDDSSLEDLRVVKTASAWRMLREPALKARAWGDLKSLPGHGG